MTDEMPDMREALGEAFDKAEAEAQELNAPVGETDEQDASGGHDDATAVDTEEVSDDVDAAGQDTGENEQRADEIDPGLEAAAEGEGEPETPDDADEKPHPLDPLAHWLKKDKEMFETLEPKAQEFLIQRDKEFQRLATRKMQEISDVQKALDPVREEMTMAGVSEGDAVRRLVTAHVFLQKDPQNGVKWLLGQYGIDPSAILGTDDDQAGSNDSAAMREIRELKEELKRRDMQTVQAQRQAVQTQLVEFAEKAEFYDKVEADMLGIVNACKARNEPIPELEVLYEQACWANPEVREEKIRRQKSEKSSRETEAAKRAQKAAGTKVKAGRSTSKPSKKEPPKTLRQDLLDNLEKQEAGTRL